MDVYEERRIDLLMRKLEAPYSTVEERRARKEGKDFEFPAVLLGPFLRKPERIEEIVDRWTRDRFRELVTSVSDDRISNGVKKRLISEFGKQNKNWYKVFVMSF